MRKCCSRGYPSHHNPHPLSFSASPDSTLNQLIWLTAALNCGGKQNTYCARQCNRRYHGNAATDPRCPARRASLVVSGGRCGFLQHDGRRRGETDTTANIGRRGGRGIYDVVADTGCRRHRRSLSTVKGRSSRNALSLNVVVFRVWCRRAASVRPRVVLRVVCLGRPTRIATRGSVSRTPAIKT